MEVLNRSIAVIVVLAIAACAVTAMLVSAGTVSPDSFGGGWIEARLDSIAGANGAAEATGLAIAVAVLSGMLLLLIFEVKPLHRIRHLPINTGTGPSSFTSGPEGMATITQDSVCDLAEGIGSGIYNVVKIKCNVVVENGDLLIECKAQATLGSNLPELCGTIRSEIKNVVEERTGLRVRDVSVETRYQRRGGKRLAVR